MNKILKSFLIIGLGLGIFTACDDDRDSNPTLISPTEFVLNTPAISGTVIDLANSSSIEKYPVHNPTTASPPTLDTMCKWHSMNP